MPGKRRGQSEATACPTRATRVMPGGPRRSGARSRTWTTARSWSATRWRGNPRQCAGRAVAGEGARGDRAALAIQQAQVHQMPGRDHQLNNDLSQVAEVVQGGACRPRAGRGGPGGLLAGRRPARGAGRIADGCAAGTATAHPRINQRPVSEPQNRPGLQLIHADPTGPADPSQTARRHRQRGIGRAAAEPDPRSAGAGSAGPAAGSTG
jgi:hypothetical protein